MDLDANGACGDIVVMLELAENLLLNLHVVFHDLRPPYCIGHQHAGLCGGLISDVSWDGVGQCRDYEKNCPMVYARLWLAALLPRLEERELRTPRKPP